VSATFLLVPTICSYEEIKVSSRRFFFRQALGIGAGAVAIPASRAAQQANHQDARAETGASRSKVEQSGSAPPNIPVITPDLANLPFTLDNGVKVFHLIAEPVRRAVLPNRTLDLWGYNGSSPGPTIEVNEGDRVRIIFENRLPEPSSMHWHGIELPNDMDGAPGLPYAPVKPGEKFTYEFTLHQNGTYFYHPHLAMQEMMGMLGAFIIHPKTPYEPNVDKDYVILLQEYAVLPNNTVPNSMNMEFNWLTFNGRSGPDITPLIVRLGDRVRVRLINLGMDHHPIHLHGHTFYVTGTEGGRIPKEAWYPGNTVLVGVAQARDFEFVANNPGEWMIHCHLPHHMMNQMSSTVGPMTRNGGAMPAGAGMEEGMGMLRGAPGAPAGEDYGPSLGRGMGVGSTNDNSVANTPLSPTKAAEAMQGMGNMPGMQHGGMGGMNMSAETAPNANKVPGFPQDAYMEGPMMAMDDMVRKPENAGLTPGWSGFMQGMMTLVRVLPPDKYDEMMKRIREGGRPGAMPGMPGMQHGF
jgi:hypothetical protein